MIVKEVTTIYSQGTAKRKEDGHMIRYPFYYIVIDGFSEPSSPNHPQNFIDGLTLGEVTTRLIEEIFQNASPEMHLRDVLLKANQAIWQKKLDAGIPEEIGRLSGATFAATKIGKKETEILAAGDTFALVRLKDGKVFITENQVHAHDTFMNSEISRLMQEIAQEWNIKLENIEEEKLNKVRDEMWNRFYPILLKERGRVINNSESPEGYGALNGEPGIERMWQRLAFPTYEIDIILLFTDGFIGWEFLKNIESSQLGIFIVELYQRIGVEGILHLTRTIETIRASESYITHAEAAVIEVQLYFEEQY
ncbi:MAG: hypothetical protein QME57_00690 [Patescibacteria group bacterium]|nr:hypothetical protein [Patescibacteria group bacterium]